MPRSSQLKNKQTSHLCITRVAQACASSTQTSVLSSLISLVTTCTDRQTSFWTCSYGLVAIISRTRTLCSLALRSLASPSWIGNGGEWDWVSCVWRGLENLKVCKGKGVEGGLARGVVEGKVEWASAKDSESFRRGERNLLAMV